MSEVKVGDTIRALMDSDDISKGGKYSVIKINAFGCPVFIDDVGERNCLGHGHYEIVTETDLTQNTTALGLMSEADQARMRALPVDDVLVYDLDVRGEYSFALAPLEHLVSTGIYRQRPEPIRVSIADLKGTIALDADGKPDFSTYEDE